jgi:hypothetical protein
MSGPLDFTNENIENTYQRVLQTDGTNVYDGTGSLFIVNTGSGTTIDTGSFVTTSSFNSFTSSFNSFTSSYNTGSFTGSFSGSLFGTSSYATTASYALNGGVTRLIAGPNISLSPTIGLGQVTITSTGGGGGTGNTVTGSYGSFYDTTIQTNPVGNVPRSMSFNTTDITNGVSISGSTSPFNTYIKTENAGVYNIQFSAQIDKTDGGEDNIDIWIRKNGIDIIDSATALTLPKNNNRLVAAWNWFVQSAANDYYQIIWRSDDTSMRLLAESISGTHPGIPSVILTVNRVDQFLSNTGSFSGSFTGQLIGTASWASQSISSSYAISASFATNSTTQAALDNSTKIATTAYVDSTTATLPANDQFILASQIFS